jgi:hypothetical protein
MAEEKAQKQNVGNAGEYYIASRLSALNFTATITLGRAEKYDILALAPSGKLIKISVKTTQLDNAKDFPLSNKDEMGQSPDFFYAFVKLNGFNKEPDFWVIPSEVVCPLIQKAHKNWETTAGKNGKQHSLTNTMRILPVEIINSHKNFYPDNWNEEVKKYYKNLKQLL